MPRNEQDSIEKQAFSHLKELTIKKAYAIYGEIPEEVSKRLEYELSIIQKGEFAEMILALVELHTFSKSRGEIVIYPCFTGTVAFCLGITPFDPKKHGLIFERTVDIEKCRFSFLVIEHSASRQLVRTFFAKRFGDACVCREIGGIEFERQEDAIVIKPTTDRAAVMNSAEETWEKASVCGSCESEPDRSVSIDIRKKKALSVIADTIEKIKATRGISIDIDRDIPDGDAKTYSEIIHTGCADVFDLKDDDVSETLIRFKPDSINELAMTATVSRYTKELIEIVIKRKLGEEQVHQIDPVVDAILRPTFGVPVFQEQLMHILHYIGSFSMTEADVIRKALGMKKKDAIVVFREKFIGNAGRNGVQEQTAERIWSELEKAGAFLFNKAYALFVADVLYRLAWLKANYHREYSKSLDHGGQREI